MNLNDEVSTIMTTKVVSVTPETLATDVRSLFWESDFHHVPVIDSDGILKGIISAVDFVKVEKFAEERQWKSRHLTAGDIMTGYPFSLTPDVTIASAIELFLANKFHALPIVDDDRLLGIVTTHDILALTLKLPQVDC